MRINYSEHEDYPGQINLWQANCQRSLSGKKGQAALRELEAALLALPAPRLIALELDDGTDCCAIGALVRYKGVTVADPFEYDGNDVMEDIGVECGMPRLVAWKTVEVNDVELEDKTPEERYVAVLEWVRKELGKK